MILIAINDLMYYETAEFKCDYCEKSKTYKGITRDMYSDIIKKGKWLTGRYEYEDTPTLKIFCCQECKDKFEKLYNKQNNKTKKKVR